MQKIKKDKYGRPYVEISEGYEVKLECEELLEEFKEKARIELRETPENVEKGVKELRELIDADSTLFVPTLHDEFLIKFLRPTKFYAQSAYDLMRRYYKFKQKHPDYCKNLVPKTARLVFEHSMVQYQPIRDRHGRRVLILEIKPDWDPSIVTLNSVFRAFQITAEGAMLEPISQVNGFVLLIDFAGLTLKHCFVLTPSFACNFLEWVQECLPVRFKAIHMVNNPVIFQVAYNIFKPFLGKKLRNRIYFHGNNFKTLLEHIDAKCLRPRYGGTLECDDIDGKLTYEMLEGCASEFELADSFGIVKNKHILPLEVVKVSDAGNCGARYILAKKTIQNNN